VKRPIKKLHIAMRNYYRHRKNQDKIKWDKQADLKEFEKAAPKSVVYMEASAGLFLIWWKDGVQTTHNAHNYWRDSVATRTNKKSGVCVQYRDIISGRKIRPRVVKD